MDRELIVKTVGEAKHTVLPENPQGTGGAKEPNCDDEIRVYISTHREVVTEIGYTVTESACMPLKASIEVAAEMAHGIPVMEAYLIDAGRISEALGGLEKESMHCAMMAELALKRAIVDYAGRRNARAEA